MFDACPECIYGFAEEVGVFRGRKSTVTTHDINGTGLGERVAIGDIPRRWADHSCGDPASLRNGDGSTERHLERVRLRSGDHAIDNLAIDDDIEARHWGNRYCYHVHGQRARCVRRNSDFVTGFMSGNINEYERSRGPEGVASLDPREPVCERQLSADVYVGSICTGRRIA